MLQVTTKGRYAILTLADIAHNQNLPDSSITKQAISSRQGLSFDYISILLRRMKKAGIVKSSIGTDGGYMLNMAANTITIKSILDAVGENYDLDKDFKIEDMETGQGAVLKTLFGGLSSIVEDYYENTTLDQLSY